MSRRAESPQGGPVLPLPEEYLIYPHRRHGLDNPHYDWDPVGRRAPVALIDGTKSIATIIVPVEFFPLNPPAAPFKHPGAIKTPYPDLRHFTTRDYGNRVGVYRLLREFAARGVQATFAVNAEIARRYRPLIDAIQSAGHEVAAHGVSTAHIHHQGLSATEERALVAETRATFADATSWMSPARNESYQTLDLIAEAGFEICLDWEADQRPIAMKTNDQPVWALPHYGELGDFKLLLDRSQSENEWAAQITEAAACHIGLHETEGASAWAFTMTPYVLGQPFRLHAMRQVLDRLIEMDGLRIATARDSCAAFQEVLS